MSSSVDKITRVMCLYCIMGVVHLYLHWDTHDHNYFVMSVSKLVIGHLKKVEDWIDHTISNAVLY